MTKHNALFMSLDELRILIIEDNSSMIKIYKNILTAYNVKQILVATNVEEAKFLVNSEMPDLIICDYILDGSDKLNNGLVFLKWIRQVDMAPACFTPVLMASGHASRRVVLEFNKFGATAIVVKPLSPTILKQRLDNILMDTRDYVVEAGRVFVDGAVKYTKPKKQDNLVYDPGFLSRLVKNNISPKVLNEGSKKIELLEEDIFEKEFKTYMLGD